MERSRPSASDIDKLKLAQNVAHSTTVAADGGVDEPAFGGRTLETRIYFSLNRVWSTNRFARKFGLVQMAEPPPPIVWLSLVDCQLIDFMAVLASKYVLGDQKRFQNVIHAICFIKATQG